MSEIITVGLDLAKNVFQLHGADASGRTALRRKPWRGQVLEFLGGLLSSLDHPSWLLIDGATFTQIDVSANRTPGSRQRSWRFEDCA